MKRYILAAALAAVTLAAVARETCTTQSYNINGQLVNCMTCCDARGNCNTSCWR